MTERVFFAMWCAMMLIVAACSSPSTPGEAAKTYVEELYNGNPEDVFDNVAWGENASAEEIEQTKEMLVQMWNEKGKPQIEAKGGVKSVEVISEDIAEDGNSAVVKMKITYGNGETEEDDQQMKLVDGKWLMSIDK